MVHRYQPPSLFFKPGVGLLFVTVWTMSIATRSPDPVLAATSLAFIVDVAKLTGSTSRDRTDHLAVADRDVIAKLLEVRRCVLPKAVRDRGHGLWLASEQLLDRLSRIGLGRVGQM